jgi:hypothetical protein
MDTSIRAPSQHTYRYLFWLLVGAVTVFRMVFAGRVGLGVDESHYALYSRHLAWGYFDHPPMVGFLAALTTLFGNGLLFIRLGPILCAAISLVMLRLLAIELYKDESVAFWAAVIILLMPYQHLLTVALLPDSTLNLFWCGTLLAFWYASKDGKWSAWVLVGLLFGGALLSKYHAVLPPPCLFLYLLTSPSRRAWLGRIQPYVSLLIGFLVFMPNVLWNAQHDWISYRFQLAHGGGGHLSIAKALEVLGGQMVAWSPVIFGFLIVSLISLGRQKPMDESNRFVFWTSLPVFVFFCAIGVFGKILPHWPSVGWWTGSIAVASVTLRGVSQRGQNGIRWRRWSVAGAITGLVMIGLLYLVLLAPIVGPLYSRARAVSLRLNERFSAIKPMAPFRSEYDLTNELFGWERIGTKVEEIRAEMPQPDKTFVFGHRFWTTSQLAVYLEPKTVPTVLHRKFNQYRLWFSPEEYVGWDALFVDENRYIRGPDRYLPLFSEGDREPVKLTVYRNGQVAREIHVYRYYGFKGMFEGE